MTNTFTLNEDEQSYTYVYKYDYRADPLEKMPIME